MGSSTSTTKPLDCASEPSPRVSLAMANRRRSPPDIPATAFPPVSPPTMVSAHDINDIFRNVASTTSRASASDSPLKRASSSSVSRTVKLLKNFGSCSTYDNATSRESRLSAVPLNRMFPTSVFPRLTSRREESAFNKVVLPQPLGPRIASTRPGEAYAEDPRRISRVPL